MVLWEADAEKGRVHWGKAWGTTQRRMRGWAVGIWEQISSCIIRTVMCPITGVLPGRKNTSARQKAPGRDFQPTRLLAPERQPVEIQVAHLHGSHIAYLSWTHLHSGAGLDYLRSLGLVLICSLIDFFFI